MIFIEKSHDEPGAYNSPKSYGSCHMVHVRTTNYATPPPPVDGASGVRTSLGTPGSTNTLLHDNQIAV